MADESFHGPDVDSVADADDRSVSEMSTLPPNSQNTISKEPNEYNATIAARQQVPAQTEHQAQNQAGSLPRRERAAASNARTRIREQTDEESSRPPKNRRVPIGGGNKPNLTKISEALIADTPGPWKCSLAPCNKKGSYNCVVNDKRVSRENLEGLRDVKFGQFARDIVELKSSGAWNSALREKHCNVVVSKLTIRDDPNIPEYKLITFKLDKVRDAEPLASRKASSATHAQRSSSFKQPEMSPRAPRAAMIEDARRGAEVARTEVVEAATHPQGASTSSSSSSRVPSVTLDDDVQTSSNALSVRAQASSSSSQDMIELLDDGHRSPGERAPARIVQRSDSSVDDTARLKKRLREEERENQELKRKNQELERKNQELKRKVFKLEQEKDFWYIKATSSKNLPKQAYDSE